MKLLIFILFTAGMLGCSLGVQTVKETTETVRDTSFVTTEETHEVVTVAHTDTLILRDTVVTVAEAAVPQEMWTAESGRFAVDVFPVSRTVHVTGKPDTIRITETDTVQVTSETTSTTRVEQGASFWQILMYVGAGIGVGVVLLVLAKLKGGIL